MGETCPICGRERGTSLNDIDAYQKCRGGVTCWQRAYDREKARADAAEEQLEAARALLSSTMRASLGNEKALAAARRALTTIEEILTECGYTDYAARVEAVKVLESALAAPAAGEEAHGDGTHK